ncbi:MAG: hypothetical protein A3A94_01025 [Candidatus Portnoybacteria bacterium RIFCSPLOWO2_01_FULL_43_11]|uniref:SpoVT-AbrB domain-containing protein n=3 Tax=Bacteria candidate phyla TaxID=1783234 RepID=A0A1G2FI45_9BACT|nr:MAG: hypothetical protein A2713_00570 [candidate division WWE3 bacterium RIFCSPHIGHO2_01_FULL_35_17]OGZ37764.1 MAG: hypothetical protein A3E90_00985 [Candidatus Portnoybacteria bacterium RIFCSPHIGHO2_12_FULL_40_11]OGZ37820.1 MAG: hypothetical protein A3A94_01025 [Candidatus Portnoybacteria bacterium RIFCSPLOWO2_01_FULL_43_11]
MSTTTITNIQNGAIVLPKSLQRYWQNKKVLIIPSQDRIIIEPLERDWDKYEEKLEQGKKLISPALIKEAVKYAKKK